MFPDMSYYEKPNCLGPHYKLTEFVIGIYTHSVYKTIMLPVVLCGCETWSLTLREEQTFRVVENKVLRKILETKIFVIT